MLTVKTHLASDSYGGKGLFASQNIKKGDVVWVYDAVGTKSYGLAEYDALVKSGSAFGQKLKLHAYPSKIEIKGRSTTVMLYELDNASYTNHSDTPNMGYVEDPAHPEFYRANDICIALRDIAAGEEITCNYHEFNFDPADIAHLDTSVDFLLAKGKDSMEKDVA